jgi:hypothetical protein
MATVVIFVEALFSRGGVGGSRFYPHAKGVSAWGRGNLALPARLRWYPAMLDFTSLVGGAADAIEDGFPPNSTAPP